MADRQCQTFSGRQAVSGSGRLVGWQARRVAGRRMAGSRLQAAGCRQTSGRQAGSRRRAAGGGRAWQVVSGGSRGARGSSGYRGWQWLAGVAGVEEGGAGVARGGKGWQGGGNGVGVSKGWQEWQRGGKAGGKGAAKGCELGGIGGRATGGQGCGRRRQGRGRGSQGAGGGGVGGCLLRGGRGRREQGKGERGGGGGGAGGREPDEGGEEGTGRRDGGGCGTRRNRRKPNSKDLCAITNQTHSTGEEMPAIRMFREDPRQKNHRVTEDRDAQGHRALARRIAVQDLPSGTHQPKQRPVQRGPRNTVKSTPTP